MDEATCPACQMRRLCNGTQFETSYNRQGHGKPLDAEQAHHRVCRHQRGPGCINDKALGIGEGKPLSPLPTTEDWMETAKAILAESPPACSPDPQPGLSLAQQFDLAKYKTLIKQAEREELEALTLEVIRLKMAQENAFKALMRQ